MAAPHITARSEPDQKVLRRPPHLVRGQAAQIRAHEVLHVLHTDRLDSPDLRKGHTPHVVVIQFRTVGGPGDVGEPGDDARPELVADPLKLFASRVSGGAVLLVPEHPNIRKVSRMFGYAIKLRVLIPNFLIIFKFSVK